MAGALIQISSHSWIDTRYAAREFVDDIVNEHNETTISEDE